MPRRLLALIVCAVALLAPVSAARADGDPASDSLLYGNAFYPYAPNLVSKPLQQALDAMLAKSQKLKFNLKVAIIGAETDLGAYPQLITEPQKYADLLQREITFNNKPRVLVVLKSGLGGDNLGDNAAKALAGITPPPDGDGDALTRTAIAAVAKLTAANGTPVAAPIVLSAPKRKKSKTSPLLTFGVPVAAVGLAALVAGLMGRRRKDDSDDDDDDRPAYIRPEETADDTPSQ